MILAAALFLIFEWHRKSVFPLLSSAHSCRRDLLDHIIAVDERHLKRLLSEYIRYYNHGRPHLSLGPGIPEPVAVFLPLQGHERHSLRQDCKVAARAVLGGLHHEYRWERIAA